MSQRNIAGLGAALVAAAFLAAPSATAREAEPPEEPPQERVFAVLFTTGPGFVEEAGAGQPGVKEHFEFITELHSKGVVPLGGPLFADDERKQISGVLYFVKAGSRQEARDIALREPMVKTRVVEIVSVREFLSGVGAGRLD